MHFKEHHSFKDMSKKVSEMDIKDKVRNNNSLIDKKEEEEEGCQEQLPIFARGRTTMF